MKKFIVLYRMSESSRKWSDEVSPEERKKSMESWHAWAKKCGSGLIDMGTPLGNTHKLGKDSHGPAKSDIAGYSILQAESWNELKEMMKEHPHLAWDAGCEIEIHEAMHMPG